MPKDKIRLDEYLKNSDLVQNKSHIQSLILSGSVLVNDIPITKVGTTIRLTDIVRIREKIKTYVSRGAFKLEGAFLSFPDLNVDNCVCIDLGASTGGFTQVLLERNARHVYAVDVGYGQLAQRIANDPRVTVLDRTHVNEIDWNQIKFRSSQMFVCMDLSFISLIKIFPSITRLFALDSSIEWQGISLIKPQFELDASFLDRGIVKDRKKQLESIRNVWRNIKKQDPKFKFKGLVESPIQGADGNFEFLLYWKYEN